MVGVEIDFVVADSLKALELYERIFDLERVEVTSFPKGQNEVIFKLYGTSFHMLDANPEFNLIPPGDNPVQSIWFNVLVPDIKETYAKAMEAGCKEIQAVTDIPDFGVTNAIFADPFGYVWMLHQIHELKSFEEKVQLWEERTKKK